MSTASLATREAPNPWWVGFVSGLASYIDACAIVSSGIAFVIYRHTIGLTDGQYGALSGALTFSIAVGALFGGRLGDRFGRKHVFSVTMVLIVIGAVGRKTGHCRGGGHLRVVMIRCCGGGGCGVGGAGDADQTGDHVHAACEAELAGLSRGELDGRGPVRGKARVDLEVRHHHPRGALAALSAVEHDPHRHPGTHPVDHPGVVAAVDSHLHHLNTIFDADFPCPFRAKEEPQQQPGQDHRPTYDQPEHHNLHFFSTPTHYPGGV